MDTVPAYPGSFICITSASFLTLISQVIRYDDGPLVTVKDLPDLELYAKQNSDTEVQRRREIRIALRALDGQKVYWPYRHVHVSTCPVRTQ